MPAIYFFIVLTMFDGKLSHVLDCNHGDALACTIFKYDASLRNIIANSHPDPPTTHRLQLVLWLQSDFCVFCSLRILCLHCAQSFSFAAMDRCIAMAWFCIAISGSAMAALSLKMVRTCGPSLSLSLVLGEIVFLLVLLCHYGCGKTWLAFVFSCHSLLVVILSFDFPLERRMDYVPMAWEFSRD